MNTGRGWNSLPESLEGSATAEGLRSICDLDLSDLESVEPPRGFGRDSSARRPEGRTCKPLVRVRDSEQCFVTRKPVGRHPTLLPGNTGDLSKMLVEFASLKLSLVTG